MTVKAEIVELREDSPKIFEAEIANTYVVLIVSPVRVIVLDREVLTIASAAPVP